MTTKISPHSIRRDNEKQVRFFIRSSTNLVAAVEKERCRPLQSWKSAALGRGSFQIFSVVLDRLERPRATTGPENRHHPAQDLQSIPMVIRRPCIHSFSVFLV